MHDMQLSQILASRQPYDFAYCCDNIPWHVLQGLWLFNNQLSGSIPQGWQLPDSLTVRIYHLLSADLLAEHCVWKPWCVRVRPGVGWCECRCLWVAWVGGWGLGGGGLGAEAGSAIAAQQFNSAFPSYRIWVLITTS